MSNNIYKSIEDLSQFAKNYKTNISKAFTDNIANTALGQYNIPEDSADKFNNILNFALNCVSKDSVKLDGAHTYFSSEFSRLLIKYYEQSLNTEDIFTLLTIVKLYNSEVESHIFADPMVSAYGFDENYKQNADYFLGIFNKIYTDIVKLSEDEGAAAWYKKDYDEAQRLLLESLIFFYILDELNSVHNTKIQTYLSNIKIERNTNQHIVENASIIRYYHHPQTNKTYAYCDAAGKPCNFALKYDYYNFIKSNDYIPQLVTSVYVSTIVTSNTDTAVQLYYKEGDEIHPIPNTYIEIEKIDIYGSVGYNTSIATGGIPAFSVDNDEISINTILKEAQHKLKDLFITSDEEYTSVTDKLIKLNEGAHIYLKKSPADYFNLMLNKNKIQYTLGTEYTAPNNTYKNSASDFEYSMAYKKSPISYIEVINYPIVGNEAIQKFQSYFSTLPGFNNLNWENVVNISSATEPTQLISFAIIFKELNPEYRNVMFSDIIDLSIANLINSLFLNSGENIVNHTIFESITTDISLETIKTNLDNMNDSETATKKYPIRDFVSSLYANSYIAHNSRESDIIRYMAGSILPDSYGITKIEKNEIEYFLDLYEETRNYYYAKLLNKSFVHDELYDEYEKYFIMLYTIERFISYKIDLIRDIDYFDETDIHNFLLSYGLDQLDTSAVFYHQDEYKLEIIRNFTELVRSKGTAEVVRILLKIFNGYDSEINIGKYMLSDVSTGSATTHPTYNSTNSTLLLYNQTTGTIHETSIEDIEISDTSQNSRSRSIDSPTTEDTNTKNIYIYDKDTAKLIRTIKVDSDATLDTSAGNSSVISSGLPSNTDVYVNDAYLKLTKGGEDKYYWIGNFKTDQEYLQSSHTLQFIEIPYETNNETKDILDKLSNAKTYDEFTEYDPYWDNDILTESVLEPFNINTTPTKYSTFDYSLNIASYIIKSRYALELAEYFKDYVKINNNSNTDNELINTTDVFSKILLETDLIPLSNSTLTVDTYFRIIRLMYKFIVLSYIKSFNDSDPSLSLSNSLSKLGINRESTLLTLFTNIKNRLTSLRGSIPSSQIHMIKYLDNVLDYFENKADSDQQATLFSNEYWPNSLVTQVKYTPPEEGATEQTIDINVYNQYKFSDQMTDNPISDTLKYLFNEWETSDDDTLVEDTGRIKLLLNEVKQNNYSRKSLSTISNYLEGVSYLSLINRERDLYDDEYIPNIAISYMRHVVNQTGLIMFDDDVIYSNLTSRILQVPYDYLLGFNNPLYNFDYKSMNFNNITNIIFEEIFKTFFIVNNNDYTINNFKTQLDKNDIQLLKENPELIEYLTNGIIDDISEIEADIEELADTAESYTIDYASIKPANDTETSALISAQILKLIELCENLGDILASQPLMQVYYQFSEEMKNTISFLTAALRLFISYTSEISEVRATQKYSAESENLIPVDTYYGVYKNIISDVLYYDEKVIHKK